MDKAIRRRQAMTAKSGVAGAGSPQEIRQNGRETTRARHAEVIRAASRIFFEKGYRATTIQDIGNAMNFTSAALYYYIGSKQQILVEIVLEPNRRLVACAERISRLDIPAAEQLRKMIIEHVGLMLQEREMFGVMFRERIELDQDHQTILRELEERYFTLVRDVIARGVQANQLVVADVSVATLALIGMINWTTRWYRKDGHLSPQQIAESYFDYIYLGFAPRALA
jgi:TetR/AcrR family transcriptional regulator, cholesterol catabolism regulator